MLEVKQAPVKWDDTGQICFIDGKAYATRLQSIAPGIKKVIFPCMGKEGDLRKRNGRQNTGN